MVVSLTLKVAQVLLLAHLTIQERDLHLRESLPRRVTDQTGCSIVKEGLAYLGNNLNNGCLATKQSFHDCCFYCAQYPAAVGYTWQTESDVVCPGGCWCKFRLDEARKAKSSAVSAGISRGMHWLVPANAFGVYHGWLPGLVIDPKKAVRSEGTLHLFARATVFQKGILVRGFAYFWTLQDLTNRTKAKYRNPSAVVNWRPEMYAMCNNRPGVDPVKVRFVWMHAGTESHNAYFEGVILKNQSSNCQLHVSNWVSSWGLSAVLGVATPPVSETTPWKVVTVFGQSYGDTDVEETTLRMAVHIEYHRRLGFAGLWSYSREEGLDLHRQLANRFPDYVTAIHWGDFPVVGANNNYDQGVIHNHALLSASFSNTYLFLSDLDEFLATDAPATVNQMVDTCMRSMGVSLGLVQCMDVMYVGGHAGHVSLRHRDFKFWPKEEPPTLEVLRNYTLLAPPVHPHMKGIVKPEDMIRYFVHDGNLRPGSKQDTMPVECMYCVHMRNVVEVRRKDVGNFSTYTSWQWVLDAQAWEPNSDLSTQR